MNENDWFSEHIAWIPHRAARFIRRRVRYLLSFLTRKPAAELPVELAGPKAAPLQPGDWVMVKSRAEIQQTLDRWNHLKGCGFLEEMSVYCSTRQRVLKKVERFLDERDYKVKKTRGIVILEGVNCQGSADFGRCDRNCSFFWRQEWLTRIEEAEHET